MSEAARRKALLLSEQALRESLADKQYARGYSDGNYGHSPSHLRGPYMDGYCAGRSGGSPTRPKPEGEGDA